MMSGKQGADFGTVLEKESRSAGQMYHENRYIFMNIIGRHLS